MTLKPLILLTPLVLGVFALPPSWAWDTDQPATDRTTSGEADDEGGAGAPAADEAQVAFQVSGMKKAKSGAT